MDTPDSSKLGSESQDSEDLAPPGTADLDLGKTTIPLPQSSSKTCTKLKPSKKGVENAKKRLRAFSIQKKAPITPLKVKPSGTGTGAGTTTVVIGKLTSVKVTPKPSKVDLDPDKKMPKPPKPGTGKRLLQESYTELQKSTIAEIEDMKRKMELVDLGIPLGLICPTSSTDKAMPTKAMPPIKSFLDPAKVDDLIREAKKAKAEGREFKFDYQKLLPDYDNPFQRKRDELAGSEPETLEELEQHKATYKVERIRQKEKMTPKMPPYPSARKIVRYDNRRHTDYRRDDRDRYTDERSRYRDKSREVDVRERTESKSSDKRSEKESKETDVNLNDYLVCDSWSLDNDDTKNSTSPKMDEKTLKSIPIPKDLPINSPIELPKENNLKKDSPKTKIEKVKLQPVIDSFKYELDSNDDEILDIFDEETKIEKYAKPKPKNDHSDSPIELNLYDYDQSSSKDVSMDGTIDDTFLESVINEIKQENMSDDDSQDTGQDKGLVEYDLSPVKEVMSPNREMDRESITPELDDRMRDLQSSRRSDYSEGYRSTESGYKSTESSHKSSESGYKSSERSYKSSDSSYKNDGGGRRLDSYRNSVEKELEDAEVKMSQSTVNSLETWSFVLKICQPLLFRHDKNKCYKETHNPPKVWYTENPKLCNCVKDRSVVYEELEMCKMGLVDLVYGRDQIQDALIPTARGWYPRQSQSLMSYSSVPASNEWEADESQTETPTLDTSRHDKRRSMTPQRNEEIYLDREYQRIAGRKKTQKLKRLDLSDRFMEAVWPEVTEPKTETSRSTTPVRQETRKKKKVDTEEDKKKSKKIKLSSEGWSQESDIEDEVEKSKKIKIEKEKSRKRRLSTSSITDSDAEKKKKKLLKKEKVNKKSKSKSAKRRRLNKKYLKKLKEKDRKKKKLLKTEKIEVESEEVESEKEIKKRDKMLKKKKQQKLKKKNEKKKKLKADSTSSSDSSSSSSESSSESTDSEFEKKRRKEKKKSESKKKNKKKRKKSTSESSQSEELFDENILNNIKTERLTDDEKNQKMIDFSPRRKPREIIDVKELQNDFVDNNLHIKAEVKEKNEREVSEIETKMEEVEETNVEIQSEEKIVEPEVEKEAEVVQEESPFKEPLEVTHIIPKIIPLPEESNLSQSSSQESISSKDRPIYEKDESHLRPSSQNSNYSFNDVITASQTGLYQKGIEEEEKFVDNYEQGNYEMYEQLAMAYQSDVANQVASPPSTASQRIETVVRARVLARGEIKCDWRLGAGDKGSLPAPAAPTTAPRPSRWGLKPGEVNIVLTGGNEQFPIRSVVEPVYKIQSIANRTDNSATGYDEAYMDMYGASDRLQYGDCFAPDGPTVPSGNVGQIITPVQITSSLDARIDHALRNTVLGEVAKETDNAEGEKETPDKGILVTKSLTVLEQSRGAKRVSFADGYKPGQDSDVEEPPKKKKKSRRLGCAWPCPASHPDHVPLWDALPPPPAPPGSPPPPPRPPLASAPAAPTALLLRQGRPRPSLLPTPPHHLIHKFDPTSLPGFMPPDPPPGLISFS